MHDTQELKNILDKSKQTYQTALATLANPELSEEERCRAAQRANDAYLEYRKLDDTVTRCLVVKKLGDLFGCQTS